MLPGRLGLEEARIPYKDRHGLIQLSRGRLFAHDGTLRFGTDGSSGELERGLYDIPFQGVSCILLGPGSSVTHDALRLLARHGTALVCTGEDGVRMYASMPFGPDSSRLARRQVAVWAHPEMRIDVARRMYAWRLGEVLPVRDLAALRGIEGSRVKEMYRLTSNRFGVTWRGRNYDRANPSGDDPPNQAINHASSAVLAAAQVATAAVGAIPQLGFIHEDSGYAFSLDIADLYREAVTVPAAFAGVVASQSNPNLPLERAVRQQCGRMFHKLALIPSMIERIKGLFDADDRSGDP